MKIFISHSSKNSDYGDILVRLLTGVGVNVKDIIYTSDIIHGIEPGENIFNWLKSRISEKPFVIYLLSNEYFDSIACLNEMGAAWVTENKHVAIFLPNFKFNNEKFQSSCLDNKEKGINIDDAEGITSFIDQLNKEIKITDNSVQKNRNLTQFIKDINELKTINLKELENNKLSSESKITAPNNIVSNNTDLIEKFKKNILDRKFKDEELILFYYILDTGNYKLKTGWQLSLEVSNIVEWENKKSITNLLSSNYQNVLNKLEMYEYIETSEVTREGNTKEVKLKNYIKKCLLELPRSEMQVINNVIKNQKNTFQWENIAKVLNKSLI